MANILTSFHHTWIFAARILLDIEHCLSNIMLLIIRTPQLAITVLFHYPPEKSETTTTASFIQCIECKIKKNTCS